MVAQASRLCCKQSVFSPTGETPVPRRLENYQRRKKETISMRACLVWFMLLTIFLWVSSSAHSARAAQKSQLKRELATLRRDLSKVGRLIRGKKFEEAEQLLSEIES
jgi:cell division protein FtsB